MPKKLVRLDDHSAEALANAIIAQAVKDYCAAKLNDQDDVEAPYYDKARATMDFGAFFRTPWFEELSGGLDGESILKRLDRKTELFRKETDCHQPVFWGDKKEAASCTFTCPFCGGTVNLTYQLYHRVRYKGHNNDGFMLVSRNLFYSCGYCGVRRKIPFVHRNVWREEWENWLTRRKFLLCSAETAATAQSR